MAAVCIWYKEEQKGNKTGMNQDRVYENRRNSYQGNPMERPEPFFAAQPLWGRSMEEQQEARERQRMQSYYSRTASDLQRLVEAGNTVLVIEHNLDVIKTADYLIDLGPEGGDGGGTLVASGTPEEVAQIPESYTGQYLKSYL